MQYRVPRHACDHPVTVFDRAGKSAGRLVNISLTGARLAGVAGLRPGDVLRIDLGPDCQPRLAQVRWVNGSNCGLRFAHPLEARALAVIRKSVSAQAAPATGGWNLHLREMR